MNRPRVLATSLLTLAVTATTAAELPVVRVSTDDTVIRQSCVIEIPPGLSGRVMVSVRWSRGSLVVRSGHRSEMIDLDAKRADGAQPAAAP